MDEVKAPITDDITEKAAALEQSLLDDLDSRGLLEPVFKEKAKEYARFWAMKARIDNDIAERGVVVYDEKKKMLVDNPLLNRSCQVSNMMQSIFRDLGFKDIAIKASALRSVPDEEDEL